MATQRHGARALKVAAMSPVPSPCAARAHALKNCLSVIYAVSQLIEGDLAERSRPRLARVREAALRMSALMDDDLAAVPGQSDTGIGVAVSRHIARRHGGDVHFESAPGSGTTVTLRLPGHGAGA